MCVNRYSTYQDSSEFKGSRHSLALSVPQCQDGLPSWAPDYSQPVERDLIDYSNHAINGNSFRTSGISFSSIPHGKSKRPHRLCMFRTVLYMVSVAHQKIAPIHRSGAKRLDFYTCTASVTLLGDGHSRQTTVF